MLSQSILRDLYDYKKFGLKPWLLIYFLSIVMPFAMIALFSFAHSGQKFSLFLDIALVVIGIYGLGSTIIAIIQLFWTTVNAPELTSGKLLRMLLTYFYMLFAFAGIFLVLYFTSDYDLAYLEFLQMHGSPSPAPLSDRPAFSGVDLRLWSASGSMSAPRNLTFQWQNLLFVYIDMLYFSMTTLTTLGFGDIVAKSPFVKIIVMMEAIFGNLLLVLGVASIVPRRDSES